MKEVDSTNNEVLRRVSEIDNLSVIAALRQTAGRGQRGNSWLATEGENLTFTLVMKFGENAFPPLKATGQFALSRCVTLGIADYLDSQGIGCSVKWPNDIYVRNKKICGVLIENILQGDFLAASAIGIGLNVNQTEFPPQLVNPVSMKALTGNEYDLTTQLPALCDCLIRRLRRYDNSDEYLSKLFRFGTFSEYVDCATGDSFIAKITSVTESGLLCLITEKGKRKEFAFKEISFVI